MNISELIATLNSRGIRLWADGEKLRANAPKGTLTAELKVHIAARKAEILESLRFGSVSSANQPTPCGLSLQAIGQLIGGGCSALPAIDPDVMAAQLRVTFRPLPRAAEVSEPVLQLRAELAASLRAQGVELVPWAEATRPVPYSLPAVGSLLAHPLVPAAINKLWPPAKRPAMSAVRADINAVIDVERPISRLKSGLAETLYRALSRLVGPPTSVAAAAQRIGWAEDKTLQKLEDPTSTQVILLAELDEQFVDPTVPYTDKIARGVNTLVSQFAEIVIGVSPENISILNMNLSDSLFPRRQLDRFVRRSLIPKIYVPIAPLPLSRFQIGRYQPAQSPYAQKLAKLSHSLAETGLFPSGFKLAEVVRRPSHRDIVSAIVNGRTGVSYGFVAYLEPPQYVGPTEISRAVWEDLLAVEGYCPEEVRQTPAGRRYLRTALGQQSAYKQVPDIWLTCSRSGADKTNLDLSGDILRIGMTGSLQLQVAAGIDIAVSQADIKPSYDTYVMVAIALAAALYTPELVANGAPMIHFHGYPAKDWFGPQEDFAGTNNPAVPCGTYESGVFNFLSIYQLASSQQRPLSLIGLVEPDHGINLLAEDLGYLLERVRAGVGRSRIELGGRYLPSLRAESNCPDRSTPSDTNDDERLNKSLDPSADVPLKAAVTSGVRL